MQVAELVALYDYYYWANGKILAQAEQVTPEQWSGPPPFGHLGLQATLLHMVEVERGWRSSWMKEDDFTPIELAEIPDAASLAARWREEEAITRAYLASLSDDDLQGTFYDFDAPDLPLTFWQVLAHLTYHGMQHRSEAAMLLTHFGHSPGSIDMVFFLFEQSYLAKSAAKQQGGVVSDRA